MSITLTILLTAAASVILTTLILRHFLRQSTCRNNDEQKVERAQAQQQLQEHLQHTLSARMTDMRNEITNSLNQHAKTTSLHYEQLNTILRHQLTDIGQQVDKKLNTGFQQTTQTFQDVLKRLTIIDQAQQNITKLSTHVADLQTVLVDHRSRGAYGEIQLSSLLHNMIPENHFSLQHTLSNGKRVDCLLRLPQPTGNIAVDAKFPLETFRELLDHQHDNTPRELQQRFKQDIRTHIQAIASKYILPSETSDGAVMFLPTEAVFAEIHANHQDIVDYAYDQRVWIASPTTMMAILTTARAVLKDEATRQQVHVIKEHLMMLNKDFDRFQKRMDQLAKHIAQAHSDVELVHTSSKKISSRFQKIESVDLSDALPSSDELVLTEE